MNISGLHIDKWMDGKHCLNGDWIVEYMIVGGTFVALLYQIFAIICWVAYFNENARKIHAKGFWRALSLVFQLCGITHLSHVWSKIYPELYLISLVYPFLVSVMALLLLLGIKDLGKWRSMKTRKQVNQINSDLKQYVEELGLSERAQQLLKEKLNEKL